MAEARQPSRLAYRTVAWAVVLVAAAARGYALYAAGAFTPRPRVALVPASTAPCWQDAVKGARAAADRLDVELIVRSPSGGESE